MNTNTNYLPQNRSELMNTPTSYSLGSPTISAIRHLLDQMENDGWSPDQHIQINNVVNAPSLHVIRPVDPNARSAS